MSKLSASQDLLQKLKRKLWTHENDSDTYKCDVCLTQEEQDSDQIVFCDACNVGVHQSCYGYGRELFEAVPDTDWYCNRCSYIIEQQRAAEDVRCELCPD